MRWMRGSKNISNYRRFQGTRSVGGIALLCVLFVVHASARGETHDGDALTRLRLDLQRPVDARLATLDAPGFAKGTAHVAHDPSEVRALSGKLKPGDQLVLAGAEWKDARFSFEGRGTMDAPIVVRPEGNGGAVFSGATEVTFHGAHLVVRGLTFREVGPARDHAVIFRLGDGEAKPAEHCIVSGVTFDRCGSADAADWPRVQLWLMFVRGQD